MTLTALLMFSKNRESHLDVILTNVPAFAKDSGVTHTGLSDHDLVYTVLKTRHMWSKAETITKRSFKTFDKDSFQADLSTRIQADEIWSRMQNYL